VRGAGATPLDELQYIYSHSDSKAVVVQDATLLRRLHEKGWLQSAHGPPSLVVLLKAEGQDPQALGQELGLPVVSVEEVLAVGTHALATRSYTPPVVRPGDLHALVYTSGTTGR
jgi:long-subunit acyl-CoA synthetase (AMP-forming)